MPSARAIPRALRAHPGVATLWGVVLAGAVVLAIFAALNDRLPGDLTATRAVQDWPFPGEPLADILRFLSGTEFIVTVGAVLAIVAWLAGRRRLAVGLAAGLAVMVLLQFGVKEIVDRPRPSPDLVDLRAGFTSPSFPSGHTMSPSFLCGFLVAAAFAMPFAARVRASVTVAAVAFLALGGLANVWLGVHWTSDVVGGYLWALAVVIPSAWVALDNRS